jgi:hypothetical protein
MAGWMIAKRTAGDISNATVSFVNREAANAVLCTSPVTLLDPATTKVGTAYCDWTANPGGSNGMDYAVGIVVDGYYSRNSTAEDTIVSVAKPGTDMVTAGGYLVNQSSSGTYAGDPGLKTNLGLNLKFNKKVTSILGRATVLVRQAGHVYQIKTNFLNSLLISPASAIKPATAELVARVSIQEVTDPLNPIPLVGNATMNLKVWDTPDPKGDMLSITGWAKNGKLLFSSNWSSVKTLEQLLGSGEIQIHTGSSGGTTVADTYIELLEIPIFLPMVKK